MAPGPSGLLDREQVAFCLATELVRIRMATDHYFEPDTVAHDLGLAITLPLQMVALELGIGQEVETIVRQAFAEPGRGRSPGLAPT